MEPADGDPTRNGTVSARAQGSLVHAPRIEQDPIAMHAVLVFAAVLLHSFGPVGGDGAPAAPIMPAAIRGGDRAADPSG